MDRHRLLLALACCGATLLSGGVAAQGDELSPTVTALSGVGVAWVEDEGQAPAPLSSDFPLQSGMRVRVEDGHQMMLHSVIKNTHAVEFSVGMVVLGPAEFEFEYGVRDGSTRYIRLNRGRIAIARSMGGEDEDPNDFQMLKLEMGWTGGAADGEEGSEDSAVALMETWVYPGRTLAAYDAEMGVVFIADEHMPQQAAFAYVGLEDQSNIPSGQLLRVVDEKPDLKDASAAQAWLRERQLDKNWHVTLGSIEADAIRVGLEDQLFKNIIEWDRSIGKDYVKARLRAERFDPEIRQVVISTQAPVSTASPAGASRGVVGLVAANEVPLISPAALSVQNIGNGVTAISLNSDARSLLSTTGSQGLGFGGLSLLAVPGFSNGIRTVGPAGLGAQRR